MAYLYGDSTPFPLNENFIETLRDTTATCLELLQADEAMDQIRAQSEQEKDKAEKELAGVERLSAALSSSLENYSDEIDSPFLSDLYSRLMTNTKNVFESASRDVVSKRDTSLLHGDSRLAAERARLPRAIERLLLRQQLPETQWGVTWTVRVSAQGQEQVHAWAMAETPAGLRATFELGLDATTLWSRPFRVGEIKPDAAVNLPRKGRWLDRDAALKEERLDKYVITEVSLTGERNAMVLRKALKQGAPGLEFTFTGVSSGVTVKALDDPQGPTEPVRLEGMDGSSITSLWETLAVRLRPLLASRRRLVQAQIDGHTISDAAPAHLARVLITAIAPYVREMCRRSAVPGELVLKREVQNGRREEMFISIHELTDNFSSISQERQAYFEEFGLVYDMDTEAEEPQNESANIEMLVQGEMIVSDEAQVSDRTDHDVSEQDNREQGTREPAPTGPVQTYDPNY